MDNTTRQAFNDELIKLAAAFAVPHEGALARFFARVAPATENAKALRGIMRQAESAKRAGDVRSVGRILADTRDARITQQEKLQNTLQTNFDQKLNEGKSNWASRTLADKVKDHKLGIPLLIGGGLAAGAGYMLYKGSKVPAQTEYNDPNQYIQMPVNQ